MNLSPTLVGFLEQEGFEAVHCASVGAPAASDADIMTIPGLGNRMLHEFKEYRPYDGIERFRREIGKYVSKEEVARLERFVTIGK